jgi:5-(carboxyamino)imidazole ribonucleotide synthase
LIPKPIGLLGGGQLGRLFAIEAKRLGFEVLVFSPEKNSPAELITQKQIVADYLDEKALDDFISQVSVVTYEFENIPVQTLQRIEKKLPVFPSSKVLATAQNRKLEKTFFKENGFATPLFHIIEKEKDALTAFEKLGTGCVFKTACFGYDGKGQKRIFSKDEAIAFWKEMKGQLLVGESWVEFEKEVSVIVARDKKHTVETWGPIENRHSHHILDVSLYPAEIRFPEKALEIAKKIALQLDLVGVLCIEMFVTKSGEILVNEMAPRPHNSGHWTIEGSATSQFEQQVRIVCGLPLGKTDSVPSAMANLLGDVWEKGEPDWNALKRDFPSVKLHLYGKTEPRLGRKMGHLTAVGKDREEALDFVSRARDLLRKK